MIEQRHTFPGVYTFIDVPKFTVTLGAEPMPVSPHPPDRIEFTVSGTVTENGTGLSDVSVSFAGSDVSVTNGNGVYNETVTRGYTGGAFPAKSGGSFTPSMRLYTNVVTDYTDQNYTFIGSIVPPPATNYYQISGTIHDQTNAGALFAGIPVVFDGSGAVYTNSLGVYNLTVAQGYSGSGTPIHNAGSFAPTSYTFVDVESNQANKNFDFFGTIPPLPENTIFGEVLLDNSPVPMFDATINFGDGMGIIGITVDVNGSYAFAHVSAFSGTSTPSYTGGNFTPTERIYVASTGTVTGQDFAFDATQLVVEPLGGNNISADAAVNASGGGYFSPLGPIIITEQAVTDFSIGVNQTFILTAPSGWKFNPGVGSLWFKPSSDITGGSVSVTATKITVTLSLDKIIHIDQFAVYGVEVQPDDGGANASGFILNLSTDAGTMVINGVNQDLTTFGQLNTIPGAPATMQILQQPSNTATAGVPFTQQPEVDTFDQFGNQCFLDYSTIVTVGSTGGGTVTGDTSETVLGGDITFSTLAYAGAGTFKLTFSASGLPTIQSNNIVVT